MRCFSLNALGTFSPSWMLCSLLETAGAIAAFKILSTLHVDRWLHAVAAPEATSPERRAAPWLPIAGRLFVSACVALAVALRLGDLAEAAWRT